MMKLLGKTILLIQEMRIGNKTILAGNELTLNQDHGFRSEADLEIFRNNIGSFKILKGNRYVNTAMH